jgi:hypothetical protein
MSPEVVRKKLAALSIYLSDLKVHENASSARLPPPIRSVTATAAPWAVHKGSQPAAGRGITLRVDPYDRRGCQNSALIPIVGRTPTLLRSVIV